MITKKIFEPKIFCFSTREEADKFVAEELMAIVTNKKSPVLGLATGGTPIGVYKYIVENFKKKNVSFQNVKTFNLDEYVNLSKEYAHNSYLHFMNEHLFNHIDIDKNKTFFPVDAFETKIKKNYFEYDALMEKNKIDLQILGIGVNGHIGFNEPDTLLSSKTRLVDLSESTIVANSRFFDNDTNLVPTQAVSMGLDTIISKTKKIILIAFGSAKKEAITQLLSTQSYDKQWPCSSLIFHKDVTIICDQDACPEI